MALNRPDWGNNRVFRGGADDWDNPAGVILDNDYFGPVSTTGGDTYTVTIPPMATILGDPSINGAGLTVNSPKATSINIPLVSAAAGFNSMVGGTGSILLLRISVDSTSNATGLSFFNGATDITSSFELVTSHTRPTAGVIYFIYKWVNPVASAGLTLTVLPNPATGVSYSWGAHRVEVRNVDTTRAIDVSTGFVNDPATPFTSTITTRKDGDVIVGFASELGATFSPYPRIYVLNSAPVSSSTGAGISNENLPAGTYNFTATTAGATDSSVALIALRGQQPASSTIKPQLAMSVMATSRATAVSSVTTPPRKTQGGAGSVIQVCAAMNTPGSGTPTLTDSFNNTWSPIGTGPRPSLGGTYYLWQCVNPLGGSGHTFTVTYPGGGTSTMTVIAAETINSVPDVTGSFTLDSAVPFTSSITTTGDNDVVLVFNSSDTTSYSAPFNIGENYVDPSTGWSLSMGWADDLPPSTYSVTIPAGGSSDMQVIAISLKAYTPPPATTDFRIAFVNL